MEVFQVLNLVNDDGVVVGQIDEADVLKATPPKMPSEIAKGIIAVMGKIRQLGYDDKNSQGNYNFASIDKFYAAIGPLMAEAGIFTLLEQRDWKIEYRENEYNKKVGWLTIDYDVTVCHESGACYGPTKRSVVVLAQGPQAFGSAQSYLDKTFMRSLFKIPTGEREDADHNAPGQPPASEDKKAPPASKPKNENPTKEAVAKDNAEQAAKEAADTKRAAGEAEAERMREEYARIMKAIKAADIRALTNLKDAEAETIKKIGKFNAKAETMLNAAIERRTEELLAIADVDTIGDEEIPV